MTTGLAATEPVAIDGPLPTPITGAATGGLATP